MKKKIFIPLSLCFFAVLVLILGIAVAITVAFIMVLTGIGKEIDHPEYVYVIPFILVFLIYSFIRFLIALKITLRKSNIITYGDGLPRFEKVQFRCQVNYNEIQNIAIIASEKDSRSQPIPLPWISSAMPKKYLEFSLINGKKERMCINYYTKWQVVRMLKAINDNMIASNNPNTLNIDEIMKDWYAYGGYNREDLKIKRGEPIRKKKIKKKDKK